jgi:DmsE family decaheme c-type cytochrome
MAKYVRIPRIVSCAVAVARGSAGLVSWASIVLIAVALMPLATGAQRALAQHAMPSGAGAAVHQAAAAGHDVTYARLRAFARDIGVETAPASPHGDDASSALIDFARMIGGDTDRPVLAQASPAKPAATPASPPAAAAKPAGAKPAAAKPAPAKKPISKKPENKGGEGEAYFVGSAKCNECHAAITAEFQVTMMGRIGRTTRKGTMECENCHGPGSKHVAAGGGQNEGMIAYRPNDPRFNVEEINETCLTCHNKGNQTAWKGSTHETRGLACTQCHTVMRNVSTKNLLASGAETDVCFQCHKLERAQMQRSSHMPIREGKMTCANCHNPHGSVYGTEAMIREPSINDNCYKCHADKRGPMLHEHPPVRENCLNCHDAHGSNHEYLLKVQRPRLCAECHGFAHGGQPGFTALSNYAFGHGCQNCHSQVHGSNHPGGQWFQR